METPPNVNWGQGWNAYKGSIVRHGVKAGLSFAIANGQGQFYYNHNGEVHQERVASDWTKRARVLV